MNTAKYVDDLIARLKQQVILALISASEACWQVALACVGWSYVYSAWEALCTPAERRKRFKLCPDKLSIKAKCQVIRDSNPKPSCDGCQWFPGGERTRCGDCRGFVEWIIEQLTGFKIYGDTVGAQYGHKDNWCVKGQIGVDPIPQNVLVNVFIKNKSTGKWTHTGFFYNGSTCECSNGVQYHEKMQSNRWTHWAIAKCFANGYELPKEPEKEPAKEPEKQPEKGQTVSYKTIRRGNYGELVKQCQTLLQKLGYDLGICGVDGDFGQATEKAVKQFQKDHGLKVDGVVGQNTWAALTAADTSPAPEKLYTVTVTGLKKAVADKLVSEYGGIMTEQKG